MNEIAQEEGADDDRGNILIVDDAPGQLLVLQTVLADLGQNIVSARSGSEALREVLRREFAVILLDVNMPDIDGFETAALIRGYKRSAHTPIIFVTAYADEMQTARGYSLGAVDYIMTPVVPEVLRSKVKVFVELNSMQRQLRRQTKERIALAAAEAAQDAAEKNIARSKFVSNASRVLSASLDIEVGKRRLLELIVPQLGDSAALLLQPEERIEAKVFCCEMDAARPVFCECALAELPASARSALSKAASSRAAARDATMAALRGRSVAVPLLIGERSLGALWVRSSADDESEALLQELASHAAMAFENSRLYRSLQLEVAERQQAQAMLQDANRRKDEFLAMLSHELRNPLAPIRNAAEVIRLYAAHDSKLSWATEVTERQVGHLTRLIDELLDVSRISQGKIVLQVQPVDILEVIAQSVETIRPIIDARRQQLALSLPRGPVVLRGDFARLSQVVSNLLHNASKYTDEGGTIELSVSIGEGEVTLAVRDDGIGIEPELLAKVFDLFEQGNRSLDRAQGGLGVGLTLAQRLVQLHNGRIEAISAGAGLGSEFRVVLPCLTEVRNLLRSDDGVDANGRSEMRPGRVLVVDDNADAAETVASFLELAGHDVEALTDGMEAFAWALDHRPDVIVLDIGLPGIDGFQLARRLRDAEQTKGALLICVTGYGQGLDRQRALDAGFDHHLVKPADPNELTRLIADWRAASGVPRSMASGS
jgi:signal transduction histidine kinase